MALEDDMRAAFERVKSETASFTAAKTAEIEAHWKEEMAKLAAAPATDVPPEVSDKLKALLADMNAFADGMVLPKPADAGGAAAA